MLLLFGFLLFIVIAALVLLMPALWARQIHHAYSTPRAVTCPETHQQVGVTIDATHAAVTGLRGRPEFRLSDCSRWPARIKCAQDCLPEALRNEPYTLGEVHLDKTHRQIYHLPVLLAAFAAWYVGMLWHSHYLFRARWMTDLGLTPAQLKELVFWYSPHLLSIAACLLFAYGVAWLQTWRTRKGPWQGILCSTLLWIAVVLATLPSTLSLSRDLLLIEGGYTLVAAIMVGAIVGGLSGRLVLSRQSYFASED
ncbi:MAG: DUF1761 domain-containing protein [Candidatus Sulfotelmatobacter sp.]